jgi:hypothetical protein
MGKMASSLPSFFQQARHKVSFPFSPLCSTYIAFSPCRIFLNKWAVKKPNSRPGDTRKKEKKKRRRRRRNTRAHFQPVMQITYNSFYLVARFCFLFLFSFPFIFKFMSYVFFFSVLFRCCCIILFILLGNGCWMVVICEVIITILVIYGL